jgi:hypothetical protein
MNKSELWDMIERQRDKLAEMCNLLDDLPDEIPFDIHVNTLDCQLIFGVFSISELTKCRAFLRSCFDGWHDKKGLIWNGYGKEMLCEYHNMDGKRIYIRLHFSVDDIPEGLLQESCRIEAETSKIYTVVCDV